LRGERVADAETADILEPRDHIADLAGPERVGRFHRRRKEAGLLRLEARPLGHRSKRLAGGERPVDDPDEGDDTTVLVVGGVEDERPRRRLRRYKTGWHRDPLD